MTRPDDPDFPAHVERLQNALTLLTTPEELNALPDYSIILSEVFVSTPVLLCKLSGTWNEEYVKGIGFDPCWYTCDFNDEGQVEIWDDYTPDLPALLLVRGYEEEPDEELLYELPQSECAKKSEEKARE